MNNKTIVALLAVALVVSLTGTIMSVSEISKVGGQWMILSGAQTTSDSGTGNTTLEIIANVGLVVHNQSISIESGYVNSTQAYATVFTGGAPGTSHWLNASGDLILFPANLKHILNNTGSSAVNLTAQVTDHKDAEAWLCDDLTGATCTGNNARLKVDASDAGMGGGCIFGEISAFEDLLTYNSNSTVTLCDTLKPTDGEDVLGVNFEIHVPVEAPTGSKTVTIQYTAQAN